MDGLAEKNNIKWKTMLFGTLLKSVNVVGFSGKAAVLESVSFHRQMLSTTNFQLVLGNCIVNAMIFIKIYFVKLSMIGFYELLKIPIIIIGAMLKKVEEVPQNMFCISSATENIIMEVPQKILI